MPGVMATNRAKGAGVQGPCALTVRAGFTLVDVLVSMAVIAVLISLMLPSLTMVRETTRRVVCASNTRQQGLGLAMYFEDNQSIFPSSQFESKPGDRKPPEPQNMMVARSASGLWDGLGILFTSEYLEAPQVFYCPSHSGDHPYRRYAAVWASGGSEIVVNYQYRGSQNVGGRVERAAMVSDGLRTQSDFNHKIGSNVLRSDFSVGWYPDPAGVLGKLLPASAAEFAAAEKVDSAWQILDHPDDGRLNP